MLQELGFDARETLQLSGGERLSLPELLCNVRLLAPSCALEGLRLLLERQEAEGHEAHAFACDARRRLHRSEFQAFLGRLAPELKAREAEEIFATLRHGERLSPAELQAALGACQAGARVAVSDDLQRRQVCAVVQRELAQVHRSAGELRRALTKPVGL